LQSGQVTEQARELVFKAIHNHFKPEFLNRLDDIILFKPLGEVDLQKIVHIQLADVRKRLKLSKDIDLLVSDEALSHIGSVTYDPAFGARPLRRYLEKHVVTEVSKLIISGQLQEHSIVTVTMDQGELAFATELKDEMAID
jgi:ATP-dependent Clp protease ATP-binding subunit ClpB